MTNTYNRQPLRPAHFTLETLKPEKWADNDSTALLWRHILGIGKRFPSLTIAWSAHMSLEKVVEQLAKMLSEIGINVFISSDGPVPIAALAISLAERNQPLGLYIDEVEKDVYSALALTTHGGPVLESDVSAFEKLERKIKGVIGTTDFIAPYIERMSHLLDSLVESKTKLASLSSPFMSIQKRMSAVPAFRLLFERDEAGPSATISSDGCSLTIAGSNGTPLETIAMVNMLQRYLAGVRGASGTLIGPVGSAVYAQDGCELLEICGDELDMALQACYTNLFLGWWEKGIIAHQGHAPFGDAYLTLLYLLESWNYRQEDSLGPADFRFCAQT